jgi:hypothetical protein
VAGTVRHNLDYTLSHFHRSRSPEEIDPSSGPPAVPERNGFLLPGCQRPLDCTV